jgi:hypothetical protein
MPLTGIVATKRQVNTYFQAHAEGAGPRFLC